MSDFPRTISGTAITPIAVTELELPGPLISVSQSGRVTKRATQHMGHRWTETFLLNTQLTAHKNFLAYVRNVWRNGLDFDIAHVDYAALRGTGGGSPIVQASAQLVTNPENFGAWALGGTPIRTSGQSDPLGGTAAYLLEDDSAAADEYFSETIVFTGNGVKSLALYLKAGTATTSAYQLFDTIAAADRLKVIYTWTAGVPSPAASVGTAFAVEAVDAYPGWYRCPVQTTSVTAANTNSMSVHPAAFTVGNVGTVYAFGVNAWNDVSPARYSGPSQPDNDAIGNVLYVNGATASVSNWLRAGDPVSVTINSVPVMLEATADVNSQTSGYAAIPINPSLYTGSTPADNSAVITTTKMRACIIAPPTFPESSGTSSNYGNLTLQFAEVL